MSNGKPDSIYKGLGHRISSENRKFSKKAFNIGQTIRQMRLEREMNGINLCRKARDLDPRTLNAIEKGRIRNPSLQTLRSVAEGLGVLVSDLFRREELNQDFLFCQGTQKGAYEVSFPSMGVKAVVFTPFIRDFFCGKKVFNQCLNLSEVRF